MKKITITGTKGKTTVSSILALVLGCSENTVLNVNTVGVYVNGNLIVDRVTSQLIWGIVPTIAPGRFLYLLHDMDISANKDRNFEGVNGVAILEASLGCSTLSGLGYNSHDVGIFINVFEDHLGSRSDLNTRDDIGKSKSFVFSRIKRGGYAVFNADDDVVCANLCKCKKGVNLIPFGVNFDYFDIEKHLRNNGVALTIKDQDVILMHGTGIEKLFCFSDITWMFNGLFLPSIYNLLAIVGALIGYNDGFISTELINAVCNSKLDPYGGRLTILESDNGVKLITDYAHEKVSLSEIAKLANKLTDANGRVIGVIRLAYDRTDELIIETGEVIATFYDDIIVYDKIDGYFRKAQQKVGRFKQVEGRTSEMLFNAIVKTNKNVTRVVREDEAIMFANKIAKPGDVVVIIVNDNIDRSIGFIKDIFKAKFV
ncbi:MAG: UDP-N-acetylmuramoyl-L-alanyl-D-glutamate--2,6-diaminopimelate ligase [Patescibacteria group bacterium]|nr:UDP-N-acetylmuramoyl-L-alanyl-D-glutamate--2,6-diaminopimelate ligase [Patescibacteria group bacterium]